LLTPTAVLDRRTITSLCAREDFQLYCLALAGCACSQAYHVAAMDAILDFAWWSALGPGMPADETTAVADAWVVDTNCLAVAAMPINRITDF